MAYQEQQAKLNKAFYQTDETLQANREGRVHPSQATTIRYRTAMQRGTFAGPLLLAVAPLTIVFLILVYSDRHATLHLLVTMSVTAIFVALAAIALRNLLNPYDPLAEDVLSIEGRAVIRYSKNDRPVSLRIGYKGWRLDHTALKAFTGGATYRVYYTSQTGLMLGTELVKKPPQAAPKPKPRLIAKRTVKPQPRLIVKRRFRSVDKLTAAFYLTPEKLQANRDGWVHPSQVGNVRYWQNHQTFRDLSKDDDDDERRKKRKGKSEIDPADEFVLSVTGALQRTLRGVQVGDHAWTLPASVRSAFARGQRYTLYYTEVSQVLLSAEVAENDEA